jgi:uncharacterized membrane protein
VAFTLQSLLLKRTRQIAGEGPSLDAEVLFKNRTVLYSVASSYLMAIGPSWVVTRRALGSASAFGPTDVAWLSAVSALSIGATVWLIRAGQGGQKRVAPEASMPVGDGTPDSAWKGGLFYFNPDDPAVFVEKRFGVGWTLNFASVWAWIMLGCAFGLPLLTLLLFRE